MARRPLRLDGVEPLTEIDRRWKRQVEELQLGALSAVRQSAEKWAATIIAILGALGVAAAFLGPEPFDDLASPWRELGMGAFFAGSILGIAALWTAGLAAHATAQKIFLPTGAEMRRVSKLAVEAALGKLAWSRACSAIAIVALFAASFCVWWAPRERSSVGLACTASAVAGEDETREIQGMGCGVLTEGSRATSDRAERP